MFYIVKLLWYSQTSTFSRVKGFDPLLSSQTLDLGRWNNPYHFFSSDLFPSPSLRLYFFPCLQIPSTVFLWYKDNQEKLKEVPNVLQAWWWTFSCSINISATAAWQIVLSDRMRTGNSWSLYCGMKSVWTLPASNSGCRARSIRNWMLVFSPSTCKYTVTNQRTCLFTNSYTCISMLMK